MDDLQLASNFMCQRGADLTATEAILCKRIKELTKERDELISEERELKMAVKQRKETEMEKRSLTSSQQSGSTSSISSISSITSCQITLQLVD